MDWLSRDYTLRGLRLRVRDVAAHTRVDGTEAALVRGLGARAEKELQRIEDAAVSPDLVMEV
jgi:hypothetical protein